MIRYYVQTGFIPRRISSFLMHAPVVVKIGGSLIDAVPAIVTELIRCAEPVLVVPGGGPFADLVRSFNIGNEHAAHWMAIAAMEQYGWYIAAHGLPTTDRAVIPPSPEVLLPYRLMRERNPLPHSWDVTSDTIAAFIARELGIELVLLKSVDGCTYNGEHLERIDEPVACDEVDPMLVRYVLGNRVRTTVLNGRRHGLLATYLGGRPCRGTVIEQQF
jgi:aspartokinase-like uncharacterized kinase